MEQVLKEAQENEINKLKSFEVNIEVLENLIEQEKKKIKESLSTIVSEKEEIGSTSFATINSNFLFSKKQIRGDNDTIFIPFNDYSLYRDFFLNQYCRICKNPIRINRLPEIFKELKISQKNLELFVSSKIYMDVMTLENAKKEHTADGSRIVKIEIKDYKFEINWFRSEYDLIIVKKDIQDFLCNPEIKIVEDTKKECEKDSDIYIEIDYTISIMKEVRQGENMTPVAYQLIR